VQALAGEKRAKMLGESDRERKLLDTSSTALAGKAKRTKLFKGLEKTRLSTHDLKASENNKTRAFKGLHKRLRRLKPRAQARKQIRALCPPENTQAQYPYSSFDSRLKPELKAQIRA